MPSERAQSRLRRFGEMVAALLFIAMFAAFLLQVFTRYVLNDPVTWTQEFVLIVYIWIVFWSAAFLLHEREHITFDMVYVSLPTGPRRLLAIVLTGLIAISFASALPGTIDYISFIKIERSPVLGIRFDFLYAIFAVFVAAVIVTSCLRLWKLFRSNWRDEVSRSEEVDQ
jgi:TRAP-type C4-dicarboxylate transport system permease small subunit